MGMTFANQLTLRWGDFPGMYECAQMSSRRSLHTEGGLFPGLSPWLADIVILGSWFQNCEIVHVFALTT